MMPEPIPTQRMQTKRWRYLGFVSAVVGLLCYALSSSFNHLFGPWNFLKFFLYFIFSFFIISITFFTNQQQRSTSTLFKTRMAVLILLATTVYSFFNDKAGNQKPDAYILMSCVAFAVMSLSLSKQTRFGCVGDLGNYFLGCLIILLMKINLWLFFVGAGFSYSLHIFFHSSSDDTSQSGLSEDHIVIPIGHNQEANTNRAIQVDPQLVNTDSAIQVDPQLVNTDSAIQVDPQLVNTDSAIQVASQHVNTDSAIQVASQHVNTDSAVQVASQQVNTDSAIQDDSPKFDDFKPRLEARITALREKDLYILHQLKTDFLKKRAYGFEDYIHEPIDDNWLMDLLPRETIDKLQKTSKRVVNAGFEKECRDVYISSRRNFLQKCFRIFDLSEFNSEESLESAINRWSIASHVTLRVLFPCERRLCERVFSGFSSAADLSFVEVCRKLPKDLLKFARKMAIQRCSLSSLSSNLQVFQTLTDLIPEFESLFYGDYSASLINEAKTIRESFGEAIRVTFDLENDIFHDVELNYVPDYRNDWIDPITFLVKKCFVVAYRYKNILEKILRGKNTPDQFPEEYPMAVVGDREGTFPSLSIRMARIMVLLHSNLEGKSKNRPDLDKDFMIKNSNYIVQSLEDSGWTAILGMDWDWLIKRATKFQHKLEEDQVLDILKLDGNESEESMKEKLKLFNMQFKEMQYFQFLDRKLRQQVSTFIDKDLLPAYGKFIDRFHNVIGKHAYEYIKYGLLDIDDLVNNLLW